MNIGKSLERKKQQMSSNAVSSNKSKLLLESKRKIQENFLNPKPWNAVLGTTQRKNGEIVQGDYRDIVDTGQLLNSLELEWRGNKLWASVDTSYDKYVMFGYVTRSGRIIRGRDFFEI